MERYIISKTWLYRAIREVLCISWITSFDRFKELKGWLPGFWILGFIRFFYREKRRNFIFFILDLSLSNRFFNVRFSASIWVRSSRFAWASAIAFAIVVFCSSLTALVLANFAENPALIYACVAFRSIRYSSTNLCCSWVVINWILLV